MTDNEHEGMKRCTKCGEWKPATAKYFNRDKNTKDGIRTQCRECRREYRKKNKEKISEYDREYYEKNKEKIADRKSEYMREYREKNKEKIAERRREYCEKNKEKIAEWRRSSVGRLSSAVGYIRQKTGAIIYLRDMTEEQKETLANQYVAVKTLEKTEKELLSASGKKRCTKCDRILDYDCFHKSNGGYAGLRAHCKDCKLKMDRKYRQQKNKKALDKIESTPNNRVIDTQGCMAL